MMKNRKKTSPPEKTTSTAPPVFARLTFWLFLSFACFYLLCSSGHIYTPDGVIMFRVTQSLLDEGKTSIAKLDAIPGFGGTEVRRGNDNPEFYAKYGLGFSLAAMPGYLIGRALTPMVTENERNIFLRPLFYNSNHTQLKTAFESFTAGWTNSLITAAIVALIFLLCIDFGYSMRYALLAAITTGIATPMWHYAKTFFSEPLAALALLGFFFLLRRGRGISSSLWYWAGSGLMIGLLILTKLFLLILFPASLVLMIAYSRHKPWRWWLSRFALSGAGVVFSILIIVGYNYLRFTRLTETGYGGEINSWMTPFGSGLAGLLISPGRGLLIYCPIVVLSSFAWIRFRKRFGAEALFILLATAGLLAGYARWYMWEGGWCWGPRFLVPVIPLLMIPLASHFDGLSGRTVRGVAVYAILCLALIVAVNGIVTNYFDYYLDLKTEHKQHTAEYAAAGFDDFKEIQRWDWRHAPIKEFWSFPHNDYLFVLRAIKTPGLILELYCLFAFGLALSLYKTCTYARSIASVSG